MSINDKNTTIGQNFDAAAQPAQPQTDPLAQPAGATGQAFATPKKSWTLHTNRMFGAPIARGVGSEYLNKIQVGMTEIYKQASEEFEITLIAVDNTIETALAFSTIAVCGRHKSNKSIVAYHMLIIEATGDKVTPYYENVMNKQVEVTRVTGDAMDATLVDKVRQLVSRAFPNTELRVIDGCVVPRTFNPDDKAALHMLALNAGIAVGTELEMAQPTFSDFNISANRIDSNLNINIAFTNQQIEDAVGQPMRSDVLVQFSSQRPNQTKNNSINSGDREQRLSEVSGFIDLVYAPMNPIQPMQQMGYPYGQMPNVQMPKYAARLILTNMASNCSYTPSLMLLNLATALSLRDDNNWIQTFRPAPTPAGQLDLRDIGALNFETNLEKDESGYGKRVDTKADNFKLEHLGELITRMVQPGLVISLDVPEAGPQTWYTSMLSAGSTGNLSATEILILSANELTNGCFSKYFDRTKDPVFVDTHNRIHLGYWTDKNGSRRDIRDFDLLAVANIMGDRNPQMIRDWSDTYTRTNYPLELRLEARKKMIYGLSGETAEFTGFAQRVTFSAKFLNALASGCNEAGLRVSVSTPLSMSEFNNQRGVANFVSAALIQPGQSFTTRGMGPQNNLNQQTYGYNRW